VLSNQLACSAIKPVGDNAKKLIESFRLA